MLKIFSFLPGLIPSDWSSIEVSPFTWVVGEVERLDPLGLKMIAFTLQLLADWM